MALGASDYRVKPDDFKEYCAEVEQIARTWLLAQPVMAKDVVRGN
jgi:hypothetical protein